MYVSVAMVTRFTKQQNDTQSRIGPRNQCTKYELYRPSNSRVMNVCICCHGNKVYKAKNSTQSRIGPRNLCTKYELHRPSNSRVKHDS